MFFRKVNIQSSPWILWVCSLQVKPGEHLWGCGSSMFSSGEVFRVAVLSKMGREKYGKMDGQWDIHIFFDIF